MKRFPIQDLQSKAKLKSTIIPHAREGKVEIVSEGERKGMRITEVYHFELFTRRVEKI